jgi:hypothetical protein
MVGSTPKPRSGRCSAMAGLLVKRERKNSKGPEGRRTQKSWRKTNKQLYNWGLLMYDGYVSVGTCRAARFTATHWRVVEDVEAPPRLAT